MIMMRTVSSDPETSWLSDMLSAAAEACGIVSVAVL
jgi:hypothetical protein